MVSRCENLHWGRPRYLDLVIIVLDRGAIIANALRVLPFLSVLLEISRLKSHSHLGGSTFVKVHDCALIIKYLRPGHVVIFVE